MKVTFLMIVFETDFVLEETLDAIIPYGDVIVVQGPVKYWYEKYGRLTSSDRTNTILNVRKNNIRVIDGIWKEKTEMCQAGMGYVDPKTDYIWAVDADEVFKPSDIKTMFKYLEDNQPETVGFKSATFFGGFDRIMGGFERTHSFKRILKYREGATYKTHRPPTLDCEDPTGLRVRGNELYSQTGVQIYHFSYVSPRMVKNKIGYYEDSVIKKGQCIPRYFEEVFLPWVVADSSKIRKQIEYVNSGVHEFRKEYRGDAYTETFNGSLPDSILKSLPRKIKQFNEELAQYL